MAVSLTTQEEAPSGPPRGVRVEAVSSTQLRVTWQVRSSYSWVVLSWVFILLWFHPRTIVFKTEVSGC